MNRHVRHLLAFLALSAGVASLGSATPASAAEKEPARIVFSNGGRILSMNADGTDRKVLFGENREPRNDGLGAIEPAVSPDGNQIVFGFRHESGYEDLIDVWSMNIDGGGVEKLLTSSKSLRYGDPDFTPSGRIVVAAFSQHDSHAVAMVFTMDAEGSSGKTILRLKQRRRPWQSFSRFAEPTISPDGKKLLYLLDPGYDGTFFDDGYASELRVLNLSTGRSRLVTDHSLGGDWSPDGKRIVFSKVDFEGDEDFCWTARDDCFDFSQLQIVNADGTGARALTSHQKGIADERSPDWAVPGRIAFQSARGPGHEIAETTEIWSITPDGRCLTRLTNGSPASLAPVFAGPEGKVTRPAGCGAKPPGPNREMGAPAGAASGGMNFWLGRSFRRVLLSDATREPGESAFFYGDCGAIPASGCGRELIIYNIGICQATGYAPGLISSRAAQWQRGVPVVKSLKPGRETPALTIGLAGRTVFIIMGGSGVGDRKQQHRLEIDSLRSVGTKSADSDLPDPLIPTRDVRVMRRVERVYDRTGSVARTANLLDRGAPFVRHNLRFARIYKRENYQTVNCKTQGRQRSVRALERFESIEGLDGIR
jgi:hypothetical protein